MLDWLVIGSGPCGTLATAKVLERSCQVGWIEKGSYAAMGRLGEKYSSVPANTRNDRIIGAFRALPLLEFDVERSPFKDAPLMSTSTLDLSIEALREGSAALRRRQELYLRENTQVVSLRRRKEDQGWKAVLHDDTEIMSRSIILATGGAPRGVPTELQSLEKSKDFFLAHDDLVVPDRCYHLDLDESQLFTRGIGIVGGSHSGMLAARNVLSRWPEAKVIVFDRKRSPRFAEERQGWIKFDGTGLKGDVALWTRAALTQKKFTFVQVTDNNDLKKYLTSLRYATFTCGFDRTNLPSVHFEDKVIDFRIQDDLYDPRTGRIAPGLYGVGIAFPEVWVDSEGFQEPRVGFVNSYIDHLERLLAADDDERRGKAN